MDDEWGLENVRFANGSEIEVPLDIDVANELDQFPRLSAINLTAAAVIYGGLMFVGVKMAPSIGLNNVFGALIGLIVARLFVYVFNMWAIQFIIDPEAEFPDWLAYSIGFMIPFVIGVACLLGPPYIGGAFFGEDGEIGGCCLGWVLYGIFYVKVRAWTADADDKVEYAAEDE